MYKALFLVLLAFRLFGLLFNEHPLARVQLSIERQRVGQHDLGSQDQKESVGLPERLQIPEIGVDSAILGVGVTPSGAMAVPQKISDVGWFKFGSRPGEVGSAVIAGHLDGENGEAGVFANLSRLKNGDRVYVQNNLGRLLTFVVVQMQTFDPGRVDRVFGQSDGRHLNLITCDGVWDIRTKSYSKRLIVFANMID